MRKKELRQQLKPEIDFRTVLTPLVNISSIFLPIPPFSSPAKPLIYPPIHRTTNTDDDAYLESPPFSGKHEDPYSENPHLAFKH